MRGITAGVKWFLPTAKRAERALPKAVHAIEVLHGVVMTCII